MIKIKPLDNSPYCPIDLTEVIDKINEIAEKVNELAKYADGLVRDKYNT